MTQFYASRYTTGPDGEWVPRAGLLASENGRAWSSIDLRPDPTIADGWAFVGVDLNQNPANLPAGVFHLGDTMAEAGQAVRDFLANRFSIAALAGEPDLRRIIRRLLLVEGRNNGTRWRPLLPSLGITSDGTIGTWREFRVHLLGQVDQIPVAQGGATVSDTFNRADNVDPGSDWTELAGDVAIVGNRLRVVTSGALTRFNTPLASADHYVQADLVVHSGRPGMNCRQDTNGNATWNGYHYRNNIGSSWQIFKVVAGAFTQIGSSISTLPSLPLTMRLQANGSEISSRLNGSPDITVTDTSITGNLRVGLRDNAGSGTEWDNFLASDLAATAVARAIAAAGSFPTSGAIAVAH